VAPSKEDCAKNKIDLAYRDYCSHKLIPLNKCRCVFARSCVCVQHARVPTTAGGSAVHAHMLSMGMVIRSGCCACTLTCKDTLYTLCMHTCRYANFFLPWKCDHERHSYEKCQYEEFERRVKQMM